MSGSKRRAHGGAPKRSLFAKNPDKAGDSFSLSLKEFRSQLSESSSASSSAVHDEISFSSDKRRVHRHPVETPPILRSEPSQQGPLDDTMYQDSFGEVGPDLVDDAPLEEEDDDSDEDELEDGAQRARRYASSVSTINVSYIPYSTNFTY